MGNGDNVVVKNNLIADNQGPGISVSGTEGDYCLIEHNTIIRNGRHDYDDAGIDIRQYEENASIIFHYNNIHNNTPHDARNGGEIDINVSNNWWGTTEPETIGQNIFDYYDDFNKGKLNYTPFLADPDPDAPDPSEIINEPPFPPAIPTGYASCYANCSYVYVTSTEDPEGDQIRYGWDWDGDGTVDEWSDYYESGHMDDRLHLWTTTGTYNVKVKAVDEDGGESEWSEALEVKVEIVYADSDDDKDRNMIIPILLIMIVIVLAGIVIYEYKKR